MQEKIFEPGLFHRQYYLNDKIPSRELLIQMNYRFILDRSVKKDIHHPIPEILSAEKFFDLLESNPSQAKLYNKALSHYSNIPLTLSVEDNGTIQYTLQPVYRAEKIQNEIDLINQAYDKFIQKFPETAFTIENWRVHSTEIESVFHRLVNKNAVSGMVKNLQEDKPFTQFVFPENTEGSGEFIIGKGHNILTAHKERAIHILEQLAQSEQEEKTVSEADLGQAIIDASARNYYNAFTIVLDAARNSSSLPQFYSRAFGMLSTQNTEALTSSSYYRLFGASTEVYVDRTNVHFNDSTGKQINSDRIKDILKAVGADDLSHFIDRLGQRLGENINTLEDLKQAYEKHIPFFENYGENGLLDYIKYENKVRTLPTFAEKTLLSDELSQFSTYMQQMNDDEREWFTLVRSSLLQIQAELDSEIKNLIQKYDGQNIDIRYSEAFQKEAKEIYDFKTLLMETIKDESHSLFPKLSSNTGSFSLDAMMDTDLLKKTFNVDLSFDKTSYPNADIDYADFKSGKRDYFTSPLCINGKLTDLIYSGEKLEGVPFGRLYKAKYIPDDDLSFRFTVAQNGYTIPGTLSFMEPDTLNHKVYNSLDSSAYYDLLSLKYLSQTICAMSDAKVIDPSYNSLVGMISAIQNQYNLPNIKDRLSEFRTLVAEPGGIGTMGLAINEDDFAKATRLKNDDIYKKILNQYRTLGESRSNHELVVRAREIEQEEKLLKTKYQSRTIDTTKVARDRDILNDLISDTVSFAPEQKDSGDLSKGIQDIKEATPKFVDTRYGIRSDIEQYMNQPYLKRSLQKDEFKHFFVQASLTENHIIYNSPANLAKDIRGIIVNDIFKSLWESSKEYNDVIQSESQVETLRKLYPHLKIEAGKNVMDGKKTLGLWIPSNEKGVIKYNDSYGYHAKMLEARKFVNFFHEFREGHPDFYSAVRAYLQNPLSEKYQKFDIKTHGDLAIWDQASEYDNLQKTNTDIYNQVPFIKLRKEGYVSKNPETGEPILLRGEKAVMQVQKDYANRQKVIIDRNDPLGQYIQKYVIGMDLCKQLDKNREFQEEKQQSYINTQHGINYQKAFSNHEVLLGSSSDKKEYVERVIVLDPNHLTPEEQNKLKNKINILSQKHNWNFKNIDETSIRVEFKDNAPDTVVYGYSDKYKRHPALENCAIFFNDNGTEKAVSFNTVARPYSRYLEVIPLSRSQRIEVKSALKMKDLQDYTLTLSDQETLRTKIFEKNRHILENRNDISFEQVNSSSNSASSGSIILNLKNNFTVTIPREDILTKPRRTLEEHLDLLLDKKIQSKDESIKYLDKETFLEKMPRLESHLAEKEKASILQSKEKNTGYVVKLKHYLRDNYHHVKNITEDLNSEIMKELSKPMSPVGNRLTAADRQKFNMNRLIIGQYDKLMCNTVIYNTLLNADDYETMTLKHQRLDRDGNKISDIGLSENFIDLQINKAFAYFEGRGITKETIQDSLNYKSNIQVVHPTSILRGFDQNDHIDEVYCLNFILTEPYHNIITGVETKDPRINFYEKAYIPRDIAFRNDLSSEDKKKAVLSHTKLENMVLKDLYQSGEILSVNIESLTESEQKKLDANIDRIISAQYQQTFLPNTSISSEMYHQMSESEQNKYTGILPSKSIKRNFLPNLNAETNNPLPHLTGYWIGHAGIDFDKTRADDERDIFLNKMPIEYSYMTPNERSGYHREHRKLIIGEAPIDLLSSIELIKEGEKYPHILNYFSTDEYAFTSKGLENINLKEDEVFLVSTMSAINMRHFDVKSYCQRYNIPENNVYQVFDNDNAGKEAARIAEKKLPTIRNATPEMANDVNEFLLKYQSFTKDLSEKLSNALNKNISIEDAKYILNENIHKEEWKSLVQSYFNNTFKNTQNVDDILKEGTDNAEKWKWLFEKQIAYVSEKLQSDPQFVENLFEKQIETEEMLRNNFNTSKKQPIKEQEDERSL